jgi:hypothetical protein
VTAGANDDAFLGGRDDDLDDAWLEAARAQPPDTGGLALLDVVAAVDHLARGLRPGFTVWDALEEGLRWWHTERAGSPASSLDRADPLRSRLAELLDGLAADGGTTLAEVLDQALRRWATAMADRYNAGYHWPHPMPRRPFPPPLVNP